MKSIIIVLLLILSKNSFAQTQEQKDSVVNEICKSINKKNNLPDTIRFKQAFSPHINRLINNFPEANKEELVRSVYFRLQRNCMEAKKLIDRIAPPKGDWVEVSSKPVRTTDSSICNDFLNHKKYAYLETSGDTVGIEMKDGYWIDHFKDGTYSKLELKWINKCDFEISFLESNNITRKNFSKPGDKYRYQVLDKKETYYFMCVEIVGMNKFVTFKIYYE